MPDLVTDINGFISQHKARRGQQPPQYAFAPTPSGYYAPSLMLSEEATNSHPPQSVSMSNASSSTNMSSCFDISTSQPSSSHTDPPPASVAYTYQHQYQQVSVPSSPLVCEFINYNGCNATFDANDEAGWIAHIATYHLGNAFPAVCVCWFCDKEFRASSYNQLGTEACYQKRMRHIAKHFRKGLTVRQIRPDFFFLDHIYKYGLIDEETFQREKMYHEAPQMPGLHPAGWRPETRPVQGQVEISRSRHRSSSTRNRASQKYHR